MLRGKTNKQTKKHQPRILFSVKLSFKREGEIKIFSEKQKLRIFVVSRSALQEMFKDIIQREGV